MRDLRPEERCEAEIESKTVQQGVARIFFDFEGRQHDRGPNTVEELAIVEGSVICSRCDIKEQLHTEGGPPFGAFNKFTEEAREIVRTRCKKLGEMGVGEISKFDFLSVARKVHPKL